MKKILFSSLALLISLNTHAQFFNYYFDTITFEETYPYLEIGASSQNIWQIGEPQKIFFNSAFSPTNAIVTDTINNYPTNNYSFFDIKIGDFNYGSFYGNDVFLSIHHKYDTDSLLDGCFITVSYDLGQTWINIVNDTSNWNSVSYWCNTPYTGYTWNLYNNYSDSLFNGEWGFSGKSNGWVTTEFGWNQCPVKSGTNPSWSDTMLVRFNFVSDAIDNNKEGWLIDEIALFAIPFGSNIKQVESEQFKTYPNPSSDYINIETNKFYDEIEIEIYSLQGVLLKKNKFTTTQFFKIDVRDLSKGAYLLKCRANKNELGAQILSIF